MGRKAKLYKINVENKNFKFDKNADLTEFFVGILVYAGVLLIANSLFKGIYVENALYSVIAALILSGLNATIKPVLIFMTLPLSVLTFGIAYPLVNMIILKLCDLIMGGTFDISGLFSTFVIAIFISAMKMFLDNMITKKVGRK